MTTKQARAILKDKVKNMTDEQVVLMIERDKKFIHSLFQLLTTNRILLNTKLDV